MSSLGGGGNSRRRQQPIRLRKRFQKQIKRSTILKPIKTILLRNRRQLCQRLLPHPLILTRFLNSLDIRHVNLSTQHFRGKGSKTLGIDAEEADEGSLVAVAVHESCG
jgi:hypothetical protein